MSDAVDARGKAWGEAWGRLGAADELKRAVLARSAGDPLPAEYWGMIAEAEVYAKLAVVPEIIGVMAGQSLTERDVEKQRQEEIKEKLFAKREKKFASADDILSCTCDFDKSQCPVHNEGDDIEDDEEGDDSR